MDIAPLHSWDLSATEAAALQRDLARRIDVAPPLERFDLVAGLDASYNRFSNTIYAAVVVVRASDGTTVEKQGAVLETTFPYIPGFLSFREAPALLMALARLTCEPDVFVFDGQGIAHPRRLGIAAHVGLWLDRPALGCAKSRLIGEAGEPGPEVGDHVPLMDRGEVIGAVVRTKRRVQPLYISPGHRIDQASATRVVLATGRGYRLPEPTRQAHLHVNALRRGEPG